MDYTDNEEAVYYLDSSDSLIKWTKDVTHDKFRFKDIHILMQYIKSETRPAIIKMMCK